MIMTTSCPGAAARLVLILGLLGSISAQANFTFEIGANEGYNGNLFDVANRVTDYSTSSNAAVRYYPLTSLELAGTGDYTRYKDTDALSSLSRGLQTTFIPAQPNAAIALHLQGKFNRQTYKGDSLQRYNTNAWEFMPAVGYQLNPRTHLRAGATWRFTDYTQTVAGDGVINSKIEFDMVAGCNINFHGSNALDVEIGMLQTRYDEDTLAEFLNFQELRLDTAVVSYGRRVRTFHFSPVFSRPLGDKTGMNVTAAYRRFASGENVIVRGAASGVLDPLSSLFEGFGVYIEIKTFLIPRLVTTVGSGYWDKKHLPTEVRKYVPHPVFPDDSLLAYVPTSREDEQLRTFISVQMPFPNGFGGFYIEPSATVSYRDNSSPIDYYDYYGWNISVGVSLRR